MNRVKSVHRPALNDCHGALPGRYGRKPGSAKLRGRPLASFSGLREQVDTRAQHENSRSADRITPHGFADALPELLKNFEQYAEPTDDTGTRSQREENHIPDTDRVEPGKDRRRRA